MRYTTRPRRFQLCTRSFAGRKFATGFLVRWGYEADADGQRWVCWRFVGFPRFLRRVKWQTS